MGSGAVPGALGGELGTILVPGWPKAQKVGPTNREKIVPSRHQSRNSDQLFVVLIFWGAFFQMREGFVWEPEASISIPFLASISEFWALGKTAESVVKVVNVRGLNLPDEAFLQFLALGALR